VKRRSVIDRKRREFLSTSVHLCAPAALAPLAGLFALSTPTRALGLEPWVGPWADPASLVAGIACGTVGVRNLAESLPAYLNGLGYVAHWKGVVSARLAELWGVPGMAGKAAAVVGPPQPHSGLIRLMELGSDFLAPGEQPTLGWRALEIRVLDVDAMPAQVAGTAIEHTGGPADLKFGPEPAAFRAAQFLGPSGEPLIFTEDLVFDRTPIIGGDNVGGIFLQTLVASPYVPTRDLYLKSLAMQLSLEVRMPRTGVEEALGISDKAMYRMSSIRAPWYSTLQVDEYPATVGPRPRSPGCFPTGVCMSSLAVPDLDRVEDVLQQAGVPCNRLNSNAIPPLFEGRSLACAGFSGEHVEFIETAALSG
jgi:hypothetical protein